MEKSKFIEYIFIRNIPEFITKYGILERELSKWNIKGINK